MSPYNPHIHHRRSIRLTGYDYTQAGAYFITICTHKRDFLFGEIVDGAMYLNELGNIAADCWYSLRRHFPHISLAEWVIMPNHMHGIVIIGRGEAFAKDILVAAGISVNDPPLRPNGTKPGSVGAIVQNYKSITTRKINKQRSTAGVSVWQRNYWEHIIRNEQAYQRIANYIINNPGQWHNDSLRTS
jgi:REP element-mobilizing transposase RayT